MPHRHRGDGYREHDSDDGGQRRDADRVPGRAPQQQQRLARQHAVDQPVDQHGGGYAERGCDDAPNGDGHRPPQTVQPDDRRLALRAGRRSIVPRASTHHAFGDEDYRRQSDQAQRQHRGYAPVERTLVLLEYRPGERLVSHERRGAEVAQRVEGNQQRAGQHSRAQQRQREPEQRAACAVSQHTGGLLEAWVQSEHRGADGEIDVWVAEQDQ